MLQLLTILLMIAETVPSLVGPVPLTPPSTWLSQSDYPRELQQVEGRTVAIVSVDALGNAASCKITVSSGSQTLDATVCKRALEHGKFKPAKDLNGAAIGSLYTFPVLWGNPPVLIEPYERTLTVTMKNGKSISCTLHDANRPEKDSVEDTCNISQALLLKFFGPDYRRADILTMQSRIIPGTGPVSRSDTEARRVILNESVVIIGPNGRVQSCQRRISPSKVKETLNSCAGYDEGRRFSGLARFIRTDDWTLHFPIQSDAIKQ